MHRQVGDLVLDEHGLAYRGLLLRHLVLPGLVEETEAILRFVAEELGPGTYVNLMAQYRPAATGRQGRQVRGDRPERLPRGVRACAARRPSSACAASTEKAAPKAGVTRAA